MTCPANIRIEDVVGATRPVSYVPPVPTGGVPPVVTNCSPLPGAAFPLGTTPVICNATDGVRTGSCSFSVTLVPYVPVLNFTRFLAAGDSITAGENGIDFGPDDRTCSAAQTLGSRRPLFIESCRSYPALLQGLLRQRYTSQTPIVFNRGEKGQTAFQVSQDLARLIGETAPEVLLLLAGINDLSINRPQDVIPNLRGAIQIAKGNGLKQVFLSTLLPMKPGHRAGAMEMVAPMNDQIRALAAEQGVVLVDNWAAFIATGNYGPLLNDDGEHPSYAGYQLIAETFLNAIRASIEQVRSTSAFSRRPEDLLATRPPVAAGRRRD